MNRELFLSELRMALRGLGVRAISLAGNVGQLVDGFAACNPHVAIVYVDTGAATDPGMQMLHFIRRSETSPNRQVPVVAVSQQRDLTTIQAVGNGGAHEYVLFPVSGDLLLKKVHAARMSKRAFIDTPEYVGPERKPAA